MHTSTHAWLLAAALAGLTGCATLYRTPVPAELSARAVAVGPPAIRARAGNLDEAMQRDFVLSLAQERPGQFPADADGRIRYTYLAISGGGANGAFGAGFISGWTQTGRRPVFKIVTGVSTGALMAPFVFLGPEYDETLRAFYTTTSSEDVFIRGSLLRRLLSGEALADTAPLQRTLDQIVDEELLRQVAEAHGEGRRLYIGTTDLDAQRFVVWNMGVIAASGHPEALPLFRKVMLASASIPVAFPPVLFQVEADGRTFDEMHVDGAVGANAFITAGVIRPSLARREAGRPPCREDIHIIHNGQLYASPSPTERRVRAIAVRSLEAAGRNNMANELARIYAFSLQEQAGYAWVGIPEGVNLAGAEIFDAEVMRGLFDLGRERALAGPEWNRYPPGFTSE
jgi:predicted acylesterase/phospholipase RssA